MTEKLVITESPLKRGEVIFFLKSCLSAKIKKYSSAYYKTPATVLDTTRPQRDVLRHKALKKLSLQLRQEQVQ